MPGDEEQPGTLDFDDTLNDAFDKAQEPEDKPEPEPKEAKEPKEDKDKTPPDDTEGEEKELTDQGSEDADKPAVEQPLEPHARWSAEDKTAFAALPRQAQEFALRRESDVEKLLTQKTQEIADERRKIGAVAEIMDSRRQVAAMNGMTPEQEIGTLYQISQFAERDPAGYIKWFCAQRGVDPAVVSGESDYTDPQVAALQQSVQQLTQHINGQQSATQARELQTATQLVESFKANTKDYPHFAELEADMNALIPGVRAKNPGASHEAILKAAYETARWANADIRAKVLESDRQAAEAKRRADEKAAAEKAAKANSTNVKKSATESTKPAKGKSWDDTMSAAYDKATAA